MLIHFFFIFWVVIVPLCAILAFVLVLFFVINRIWPSAAGGEDRRVSRREEWRPVLDAEVKRWSAKTCEQLVAELADVQAYEVEFGSKPYQVEVEILENTAQYVNVIISVHDGSLPDSIAPLTDSIICRKGTASGRSCPESPRPT